MQIIEPTLLLDKKKCLKNIAEMTKKAERHKVTFRPHFKTHQSKEIGRWIRAFGVDKITVSSLKMAEYFAEDDWRDITVAFPVNLLEIKRINRLAAKIKLNLLVESHLVAQRLDELMRFSVSVFIKIDTGYHRTGLTLRESDEIDRIIYVIEQSKHLIFKGFLVHSGNTYSAPDSESIERIHNESLAQLEQLKEKYGSGERELVLSVGDTPSCAIANRFGPSTEIRPGTFVFYDLMQYHLGACNSDKIAIAMACPVVAKHPARNEIVIYGGAVHFSKDYFTDAEGEKVFGYYARGTPQGWGPPQSCCKLKALSQEHGIIRACDKHFAEMKIGQLIHIIPVHSCLTANLMKSYLTLDGQKISRL